MKNYINLGKIYLGNLDKIHNFILLFSENKHKLEKYPTYTEIKTDINLNDGSDLICMKYGTINVFYTVKGEILKQYFDNWDNIQKQVESKVGKVLSKLKHQ